MKRMQMLVLVAAVAFSAPAFGQVAGKEGVSVEEQVADLERQWLDAVRTRNFDFLEKLFAPEFREMSSTGDDLARAEMLERLKTPGRVVDELHSDNIKVHVYGNVAVLTDYTTIKGHAENGTTFGRRFRSIRIFVQRQGKWQAVAGQATPLKE